MADDDKCGSCNGTGNAVEDVPGTNGALIQPCKCKACDGTGKK